MFGQKKKTLLPRPWYAEGLHFTCTQCGNCCSGTEGEIPVTQKDIGRIAAFLGVSTASFKKLYTRTGDTRKLRLLKMRPQPSSEDEEDCIFLDRSSDGAICLIHEVKPSQCRAWPFWPDALKSRTAWEAAGKHCCGIDRDPDHVTREEISSHHRAMEALERTYGKFEQGWD